MAESSKGAHWKLGQIQTRVGEVAKTGRHPQNFRYIEEHKVFELLRPLLREFDASVVVSCADDVAVTTEVPFGRDRAPATLVTLTGTVTFTDNESGEQIVGRYVGQGIDTQDKASGKAQTYLTKYALQKFFLIPTQHIDDADATTDDERQPAMSAGDEPTQKQLDYLVTLAKKAKPTDATREEIRRRAGVRDDKPLTREQVSAMIETYKSGLLPDPSMPPDIPTDLVEAHEGTDLFAGSDVPFDTEEKP